MGMIVSQSRPYKPNLLHAKRAARNYDPLTDFDVDYTGQQRTTSFRTDPDLVDSNTEVIDTLYGTDAIREWRKSTHDTGHEFFTIKRHKWTSHPYVKLGLGSEYPGWPVYYGPLSFSTEAAPKFWEWAYEPSPISVNDINLYGNKLVKAAMPTNPHAQTLNAIIELFRDGLPAVTGWKPDSWQGKIAAARKLGDGYLNLGFGWAPLVSDLRKIIDSLASASKLLYDLEQGSGQTIHRRRKLSAIDEIIDGDQPSNLGYVSGFENQTYSVIAESKYTFQYRYVTHTEYSFSGSFIYHINKGSAFTDKIENHYQKAQYLLGLRLTPEVLWNAAPWSWLVDWFADVSSALAAVSEYQDDGLVMKYGYLMKKTIREVRVSLPMRLRKQSLTWEDDTLVTSYFYEQKERVRATPFGFGVNMDLLDPRQWSILAALGSKAPRTAW